jgi:hypothetical protein
VVGLEPLGGAVVTGLVGSVRWGTISLAGVGELATTFTGAAIGKFVVVGLGRASCGFEDFGAEVVTGLFSSAFGVLSAVGEGGAGLSVFPQPAKPSSNGVKDSQTNLLFILTLIWSRAERNERPAPIVDALTLVHSRDLCTDQQRSDLGYSLPKPPAGRTCRSPSPGSNLGERE